MHKNNGTGRHFKESEKGLFYLDTSETMANETVLVNTVDENKSNYMTRDYGCSKATKHDWQTIDKGFVKIVQSNLPNCPITTRDIMVAEDILGPNLGSLKGKTVYRQGGHVKTQHINLPMAIISKHQQVVLCIDIISVNKIPFLETISRRIKFGTAEMLHRRDAKHILKAINNVSICQAYMPTANLKPFALTCLTTKTTQCISTSLRTQSTYRRSNDTFGP